MGIQPRKNKRQPYRRETNKQNKLWEYWKLISQRAVSSYVYEFLQIIRKKTNNTGERWVKT